VTARRRRLSLRIVAGLTLLTAGLAIVGFLLWEFYGTTWVSQHHQQEALEQVDEGWRHQESEKGWRHQESAVATTWGDATGIVKIPRFGSSYRVPLFEGTDDTVLAAGFGHITGTAGPGEAGNFVIAAHRVTHGEPLRRMPELQIGDHVIVETRDTTYDYELVTGGDALVVPFTAEWVTTPQPHNPVRFGVEPPVSAGDRLLTLTTCAELFHTDNRLVAFGELQRSYPTAATA
jgi:sortase A